VDTNVEINFGDYLKARRVEKGLSIDMVWKQTRVTPTYLEALESGNWLKLPAKIFVQSYLRAYAKCVGLQPEDVLRRFAQAAAGFYDAHENLSKLAEEMRQKQYPHSSLTRLIDRIGTMLRPRPATPTSNLAIN